MSQKQKQKQFDAALVLKNGTRGILGITRSYEFKKQKTAALHIHRNFRRLIVAAESLSVPQYEAFLEWAQKTASAIVPNQDLQRIQDYPSLSDFYEIGKGDIAETLAWWHARLRSRKTEIQEFFNGCRKIESLALRGHLDEAVEAAVGLESKHGASMHLLELRIALAQLRGGVEEQKKLVTQLKGGRRGGLAGLAIYFVSMRNEPKVSLLKLRDLVEERAGRFKEKCYGDYLRYRLLRALPEGESSIDGILQVENNHAIFDMAYTANQVINRRDLSQSLKVGAATIEFFRSLITPPECDSELSVDLPIIVSEALKHKDGKTAYKWLSRQLGSSVGFDIGTIRVFSFIKAQLRSGGVKKKTLSLAERYTDELAAQMQARAAIDKNGSFAKTALNFSVLPLSSSLSMVGADDTGYPLSNWMRSLMLQRAEKDELTRIIETGEGDILQQIRWLISIDTDQRTEFLLEFLAQNENQKSIRLAGALAINTEIAQAFSCAMLERYAEYAGCIARLAVDKKVLLELLPATEIFQSRSWKDVSKGANLVHLAIALEISYRIARNDIVSSYRRYAIEDLLLQTGKKYPSELTSELCHVSSAQFNFFLDDICVEKNLDIVPALKNTKAIDGERLRILSILAHSDKPNAPNYNTGIVSILHKARIEQGLALLDGSRVHVDEEPLTNKISEVLHDSWERYLTLISVEGSFDGDMGEMLRKIAKEQTDEEIFSVPPNEADNLLHSMVVRCREAFLNDPDHGLDRYLGHRIRHNAFANHLRDSLTPHKLITKLVDKTTIYQPNIHWEAKLSGLGGNSASFMLSALESFGRDFDALINSVNENKLRVKRAEYPDGIFGIVVSQKALEVVRAVCASGGSAYMFVHMCFQIFWLLLEPSLSSARALIVEKMGRDVATLIGNLSKACANHHSIPELLELQSTVVQAHGDITRALEKSANWFNKRFIDENAYQYSVEDAMSIVLQACTASHRYRAPRVSTVVKGDVKVRASTLYQLSDIFWILIDNACTHSHISSGVNIDVEVDASYASGNLKIKVENALGVNAKSQVNFDNIESIRNDIARKSYKEKVMVEGKSGLKKLAAMAQRTTTGTLDFGYHLEGFKVEMQLPLSSVYVVVNGRLV